MEISNKNKIISQVELDIPTFTKDNLPKELSLLNQLNLEVEIFNEKN